MSGAQSSPKQPGDRAPQKPGWHAKARAAFVLFHALSILVLCLPAGVANETRWASTTTQRDLNDWAAKLQSLGIQTDKDSLEQTLKGLAQGYIEVRRVLARPFGLYTRVTLTHQSWAMFASPQRRPYELHVDGLVGDAWVPLHRPLDDSANVYDGYLQHNRVRKFTGRFAKNFSDANYTDFATFLARRAFEARPDVERVRISLYGYATLPPEQAARGERPEGAYEHPLELSREDVR
jgi:hypothetical protein